MRVSTTVIVTLALVSGIDGFWRMPCAVFPDVARVDPVISPGNISSHAHSLHGSFGLSLNATYGQLVDSNTTSCAVKQDKSAYW
jgi:Domain of unknown function (DUF1996)